MAVTQKHIAQELGVSRQLVGYALTDTGTISAEMKQRIVVAAQKMGYRRNAMAAGVRNGTFGSVALLLSSHPNASTLPLRVFDSILATLEQNGLHLIVHRLPMAMLADASQLPKVLTEWMCDGLLIDVTHEIPPHMMAAIEKSELPATWLNVPREVDTVRPDDYSAGRVAARHLLELGHRRICYADLSHPSSEIETGGLESKSHYSVHERYAGVRDEMRSAGEELLTKFQGDSTAYYESSRRFDRLYTDVKEILLEQKPTAIITYDEIDFVPLIVARDLGMKIPHDLSLINFGSAPHWFMGQQITTLVTPEREMGRRLTELLFEKMASPASHLPTVLVPFTLVQGETSGSAKMPVKTP